MRTIEMVRAEALKLYARNARTHSKRQIRQIADSIERFGFVNPVLVDDDAGVITGHGRVEAAKLLGIDEGFVTLASFTGLYYAPREWRTVRFQ
jgi:ParB-like chromosome segregation protein Spo0J